MEFPIYLMRHGQTEWNAAGRMQGHLDSPLTKLGRQDAARLAELLIPVFERFPEVAIYASPQGRVRETWEIALGAGRRPIEDARLKEVRAGRWQGMTDAEMEADQPHIFAEHQTRIAVSFHTPDGESFEEVEARCRAFLAELTGPSLVFTHGVTMAVLRGVLLGVGYRGIVELDHRQGVIYAIEGAKERVLALA